MSTNNRSGIYQIRCTKNNQKYIGQAKNIDVRWKQHVKELDDNEHHNYRLQNDWNKYGKKAFKFSIIEVCRVSELDEREAIWIEKRGQYNIVKPRIKWWYGLEERIIFALFGIFVAALIIKFN